MQQQQFADGATVYDTADEKIGTLREYNPQGGYLMVEKGWLFPKDFYVPLAAVQSSDSTGDVHLSLHKADLQGDSYDYPPSGTAAGARDYGQTVATTETTTTRAQSVPSRATAQVDETIDVPVYEEELVVGTRQAEQGRVHLHKDVVTEQQTANVALQQEQVTVERVPFTGQTNQADIDNAFRDQDIEVPVMGEEAVVSKQAHVTEEVHLHKNQITENAQVSDTVRKERVTIENTGDVDGANVPEGQRPQTTPQR